MDIFDTVDGDAIEEGDQVVIDGQPIEVSSVEDAEVITVSGYSHTTGDYEDFVIDPFAQYEIWGI